MSYWKGYIVGNDTKKRHILRREHFFCFSFFLIIENLIEKKNSWQKHAKQQRLISALCEILTLIGSKLAMATKWKGKVSSLYLWSNHVISGSVCCSRMIRKCPKDSFNRLIVDVLNNKEIVFGLVIMDM